MDLNVNFNVDEFLVAWGQILDALMNYLVKPLLSNPYYLGLVIIAFLILILQKLL